MSPDNFTWNDFQHGILLNASIDDVFKYVATPKGITEWFIGAATYTSPKGNERAPDKQIQAGDRYHWEWLHKDFASSGEVLEVKPGISVKVTFGGAWEVLFQVASEGKRTRLSLSQYYTPNTEPSEFGHLNCCVCWVFFLTNLKSVAEHGTDLREVEVDDEVLVNR